MAVPWIFGRTAPVISTKLQPPLLPPDFVERPRLLEQLRLGIGRKLTLVCAPAGFGKTTLLAGWLHGDRRPVAWVSLDVHDSDLLVFVQSFVNALETIRPATGRETQTLLNERPDVALSHLGTVLADDLARIETDIVVVLDDYHLIQDQSVHVLLSTVLRRLPANVQFVVASRENPPLPSAALRARRELAEIQANDLRFDLGEARAFMELTQRRPVPEPAAAELLRRSEGWPVGLRLSTLAAQTPGQPGEYEQPAAPLGGRHVDEYLFSEVLAHQPPETRTFLLYTSVLDRLCGPLCEAVVPGLAPGSGRRILAEIERSGLFMTALDDTGHWYRYHDLFRDMLVRRLEFDTSPTEITALHARASAWLAAQNLTEEAIQHALAAHDPEGAVRLVEEQVASWRERQQWAALEAWLNRLPPEHLEHSLILRLARCRLQSLRGQVGQVAIELRRLETYLDEHPSVEPTLATLARGEINGTMSYLLALGSDSDQEAFDRAELALRQLPMEQPDMRATAAMMYPITAQMIGRGGEGLAWVRAELDEVGEISPTYTGRVLIGQGYVELSQGRLTRLRHTGAEMVSLGNRHGIATVAAWGHYMCGRVAYEWNDLDTAQEHFAAGLALRDRANLLCVWNTTIGLALTLDASGRGDDARRLALDALEVAKERQHRIAMEGLRSLLGRLALTAGDLAAAVEWTDTVAGTPRRCHAFDIEDPLATRARVLIAQDTDASLKRALDTLDQSLEIATARRLVPQQIETLALRALAHSALGANDAALAVLTRALELAESGRFTRAFVGLGPPLAGLLIELTRRGQPPSFARHALDACRSASGLSGPAVPSRVVAPADDVEPLTWRELEILQLLDARYSNKEIARTLCISWETVKKHAANIYSKLHVAGRRDAVARARTLGMLGEDRRVPV